MIAAVSVACWQHIRQGISSQYSCGTEALLHASVMLRCKKNILMSRDRDQSYQKSLGKREREVKEGSYNEQGEVLEKGKEK